LTGGQKITSHHIFFPKKVTGLILKIHVFKDWTGLVIVALPHYLKHKNYDFYPWDCPTKMGTRSDETMKH
jgi:hypothetical protein